MQTKLSKKSVKIIVTDSGLGGLSICAELVSNLQRRQDFDAVEIIYFDAIPSQKFGYNLLPDTPEKIRVFNQALYAMQDLQPDLILIACNTLSVLYDDTPFSRQTQIPVVDIIDFGVEMLFENLNAIPGSHAVIYGTPTTIEVNSHALRLIERGISADRLIPQACLSLAGEIEKGHLSPKVNSMIEEYTSQALAKLPDCSKALFAAFCCTHYNYSRELFVKALAHLNIPVTILNPNSAMSDCVTGPGKGLSVPSITVEVVTKVFLSAEKIQTITGLVEPVSPLTAAALRGYTQKPDLFLF